MYVFETLQKSYSKIDSLRCYAENCCFHGFLPTILMSIIIVTIDINIKHAKSLQQRVSTVQRTCHSHSLFQAQSHKCNMESMVEVYMIYLFIDRKHEYCYFFNYMGMRDQVTGKVSKIKTHIAYPFIHFIAIQVLNTFCVVFAMIWQ